MSQVFGQGLVEMDGVDLTRKVIEQLAVVRAQTTEDVIGEVEAAGMDAVMVDSHQIVFILVELGPEVGVDANDPNVLKGCNLQSLADVVQFLATSAGARA